MPILAHVNADNPFLHTLSVTDGKKFDFCTRSRLRTEKKFTASRRHVQGIKTVCFPNYGRNKKPFFAYVIGYGGKKVHARILFFGRSTLSAGVRPLSSPIGPRQICDGKRRRSNAIFFSRRAGVHFFFFCCGST